VETDALVVALVNDMLEDATPFACRRRYIGQKAPDPSRIATPVVSRRFPRRLASRPRVHRRPPPVERRLQQPSPSYHTHSLDLAMLDAITCSGQQQVSRPHATTSAHTLGRRQVPWAVMPRYKLSRPISSELALLMWISSRNRLGRPQCLRLRRPAHKVSKLPVLPVGVRV